MARCLRDLIPFHSKDLTCCPKSDVSWLLCGDLEWLCESSCHEGFLTRLVYLMPDPSATKSCRARGLTPPRHPLSSTVLGLRGHNSKHGALILEQVYICVWVCKPKHGDCGVWNFLLCLFNACATSLGSGVCNSIWMGLYSMYAGCTKLCWTSSKSLQKSWVSVCVWFREWFSYD